MDRPLHPLTGRYWRMLGIKWQREPFSSGSQQTGGRWNAIGTPALYLSADFNTAITEMHQTLIRPGTLVAFDVEASSVADLRGERDEVTTANWRAIYRQGGRPGSWALADELIEGGCDGALVPSIQNRGGANLVLWRWHDAAGAGEGARLTLLDPEAALKGEAP